MFNSMMRDLSNEIVETLLSLTIFIHNPRCNSTHEYNVYIIILKACQFILYIVYMIHIEIQYDSHH